LFAQSLARCLGDRPESFFVCSFSPRIFTFQVANSNVAVELLIQGIFAMDFGEFLVAPLFRVATLACNKAFPGWEEDEDLGKKN
jgi:hypothetical protein